MKTCSRERVVETTLERTGDVLLGPHDLHRRGEVGHET